MIAGTLALVGVVGAALIVITCGERPEVSYPDAAAARRAGAVDRGWIPDWMPSSARDIHEIHDIASNQSMLAFSFHPKDPPVFAGACAQVQREDLKPIPFRPRWWPNEVPPPSFVTHRDTYYHCASDKGYVAVSFEHGELYFWRP